MCSCALTLTDHTTYQNIREQTGTPVKDTSEEANTGFNKKHIYSEDNLEKPRGQRSSCEQSFNL